MTSGELTKNATMKLKGELANIERNKRRYKYGGDTITPKEKADIMSDQDKASTHIYKEKHDAQTRYVTMSRVTLVRSAR